MKKFVTKLFQDTLMIWGKKPDGTDYLKFSRTSLTMFGSFWIANFFAFYDFHKNGFDFQVFLTYIGIATGMKIVDVFDKGKNTPPPPPPSNPPADKKPANNTAKNDEGPEI